MISGKKQRFIFNKMFWFYSIFYIISLFSFTISYGNQVNSPIWFGLEDPVKPFIGRVSELNELNMTRLNQKTVVVQGKRGIGKTELVRKYAQNVKQDNVTDILWLDATSQDSITKSLIDLNVHLDQSPGRTTTGLLQKIYWFFKNRHSIFIFDHASSNNVLINHLMIIANMSKHVRFIITSRYSNWEDSYKLIEIKPFSTEETLSYINNILREKKSNITVDSTAVERLAKTVDHLPLALKKAIDYTIYRNTKSVRKYTFDNYVEDFTKVVDRDVILSDQSLFWREEPWEILSNETSILFKVKSDDKVSNNPNNPLRDIIGDNLKHITFPFISPFTSPLNVNVTIPYKPSISIFP